MADELPPLPPTYDATRQGLHALAEHILSPLRYRVEERIGLRPIDGGFGPPLADRRRVVARLDELCDDDRTAPITTLGGAGRFLGVPVGAPPVYEATTDSDPERPLAVAADAGELVGRWFALGDRILAGLVATASPDDDPTEIQLWPEHFDLALAIGPPGRRANVGASPGDGDHPEPYLYVGPFEPRSGDIWNEPWGASLRYDQIRAGADPTAFIQTARQALSV